MHVASILQLIVHNLCGQTPPPPFGRVIHRLAFCHSPSICPTLTPCSSSTHITRVLLWSRVPEPFVFLGPVRGPPQSHHTVVGKNLTACSDATMYVRLIII